MDKLDEEILRPVGGHSRVLLEQGLEWRAEVRHHMSANEQRILHHLERYQFAAETLGSSSSASTRILDIGAGDGSGLSVINEHCKPRPAIDAIELDKEACDRMQQHLPDVNIFNLSVDDFEYHHEYDLTLLFETLGHQHIVSDLELLRKLHTRMLILSVPYYRHYDKKFYFYRLYDPVSLRELMEHAMPGYVIQLFGQLHPVNRNQDSECGIIELVRLDRDPDFIIAIATKI